MRTHIQRTRTEIGLQSLDAILRMACSNSYCHTDLSKNRRQLVSKCVFNFSNDPQAMGTQIKI